MKTDINSDVPPRYDLHDPVIQTRFSACRGGGGGGYFWLFELRLPRG